MRHEADLCINTIGNTKEATVTGSAVVNRILVSEINQIGNRKIEVGDTLKFEDNANTHVSLKSLLHMLQDIKGNELESVTREGSCNTIRITCCSNKAFVHLIEALNSTEFDDGIYEVRKALEKDIKGGFTYSVEANLSTRTLNEAEKTLGKKPY